ncbi:MAG: SH3 domain-containing protein, partial [Aggregatilineales bacterium]
MSISFIEPKAFMMRRFYILLLLICFLITPIALAQAPGFVATGGGTLRLRAVAGTGGRVLANLPNGTPLSVYGRNGNSSWLKVVTAQNAGGWVSARYVTCNCNVAALPVDPPLPVAIGAPAVPAVPAAAVSYADTLIAQGYPAGQHRDNPGAMLQVYYRGQALGNRSTNFSKIGDSMTASEMFMRPFSHSYNLGQHTHLQPVLNYFKRGTDSFDFVPIGAQWGWRSDAPLNPAFAHPGYCRPGEMPIACEYRVMRPSVALIMIGSNDLEYNFNLDYYAQTMETITQFSLDSGVIPILSTLPRRAGYEFQVFACNDVIRGIAAKYGVP